jgi:uncharacterized protein YjbI with pentapeptide repeats
LASNLNLAELSGVKLSRAKLAWANLSGANISSAILIGIESENYESMTVDTESDFTDAICDSVDLY